MPLTVSSNFSGPDWYLREHLSVSKAREFSQRAIESAQHADEAEDAARNRPHPEKSQAEILEPK